MLLALVFYCATVKYINWPVLIGKLSIKSTGSAIKFDTLSWYFGPNGVCIHCPLGIINVEYGIADQNVVFVFWFGTRLRIGVPVAACLLGKE